jgi:FKBP-type peptidyl-prolyl cis-trans isomerase FkpA
MKQTIFTLLLLSVIGLVSCHKHDNQPNIEQYDQEQIQNYITANSITGMKKDLVGGDTSGIYYKIILQPQTTDPTDTLTYSDNISFVFTLKSFDGHYISTDTIENHYQGYVGHIVSDALPAGLEIAVLNDLRYVGASMRVLIPSHLAYGKSGYGTGSITNTSTRIAGNQCLDYYVHVIARQPDNAQRQLAYDDQVIKNYLAANNLTSLYTLDSGVYYHVQTAGTGTDPLTDNTTTEVTFNARLLNDIVFSSAISPDSTSVEIPNMIAGVSRTLKKHAVQGTVISMIMPSYLGYGTQAQSGIPANSCLRFEFTIQSVSP